MRSLRSLKAVRPVLPFLFLALLAMSLAASAAEMPGEANLTADRMRFDSRTGDFLATGNVVIRSGGLTVCAPRGDGNAEGKEVHFKEGAVASGDWQGQWIDITAGSISLYFAQTPTYIAEGKVKGRVGKILVDADKFYMKGEDISGLQVRRLEDLEADVAFGAEKAQGTLRDGVLTYLKAQRGVWVRGRPNSAGEMTDIRGDSAVYSVERGSVVVDGSVKAVQKGRTLTSKSLVYFPDDNRVEALGGIGPQSGGEPSRAQITIDMNQEKQKEKEREKKR